MSRCKARKGLWFGRLETGSSHAAHPKRTHRHWPRQPSPGASPVGDKNPSAALPHFTASSTPSDRPGLLEASRLLSESRAAAAAAPARASPMADKEPVVERREEEEGEGASAAAAAEEEDTGAQVAPIVRLEEVAITTGEEDEDVLLDMKAKLYRFDKDGNQWKERGTGTVKLLKHKENGKVRLVMRQAKTLKICANHLVISTTKMQEHAGSDKSCVWHAVDFADGELKEEMFAIRFGSVENCKKFKDLVDEIAESLSNGEGKENEEGSSAAGLLEKLSVSDNKSEEATTKEESTDAGKETDTKLAATSSE